RRLQRRRDARGDASHLRRPPSDAEAIVSPRVAILVACYDDGATLSETVDSLRHEPDSELVIVDDGSTDPQTHEVLHALESEGLCVIRKENGGPASAWMAGLAETSASYVMSFSSDDL